MQFNKAVRRANAFNKIVPQHSKVSYFAQRRGELDHDSIIVQCYDGKPVGVAGY